MSLPDHLPTHPNEKQDYAATDPGIPNPAAPASAKSRQRATDRLNIPSSLVRASGFQPGDIVYVTDEDPVGAVPKPCLLLWKEVPQHSARARYKVSADCRIRVTSAVLKIVGFAGDMFEVDGGDGKIIIRQSPREDAEP